MIKTEYESTYMKALNKTLFVCIIGFFVNLTHAHNGEDEHVGKHPAQEKITISTVNYTLPEVDLVRDDGKTVSLSEELNDGRPVILNFIYTTCKAVCPISSQIFYKLQGKLGTEAEKVHMVSISIDPEQDTPSRLKKYAKEYKAGPQWQYYTGSSEASIATQRAFDVYHGDKMSHTPVTLLRASPGKSWSRIDGFATADDLLREYKTLVSAQ